MTTGIFAREFTPITERLPVILGLKLIKAWREGDSEGWQEHYYFLRLHPDDRTKEELRIEDALEEAGISRYYGGPGRAFSGAPSIRYSKTRVLVWYHGGLDI